MRTYTVMYIMGWGYSGCGRCLEAGGVVLGVGGV
jgi:hypothetical protein